MYKPSLNSSHFLKGPSCFGRKRARRFNRAIVFVFWAVRCAESAFATTRDTFVNDREFLRAVWECASVFLFTHKVDVVLYTRKY